MLSSRAIRNLGSAVGQDVGAVTPAPPVGGAAAERGRSEADGKPDSQLRAGQLL